MGKKIETTGYVQNVSLGAVEVLGIHRCISVGGKDGYKKGDKVLITVESFETVSALKKVGFPECSRLCKTIVKLGAGECENICPEKFKK